MPRSGYINSKWISHARLWNVRASIEVLTDVGQRLPGEVIALEVPEAELELPLALPPDGVEVLEEPRQVALDAGGAVAELPHSEVVAISPSYGNGPPSRVAKPLPGGSGSQGAAVCVPHAPRSR